MPILHLTTEQLQIRLDIADPPYPYSGVLTCGEKFFDCFPREQADAMKVIFEAEIPEPDRIAKLITYLNTLNKYQYPRAEKLASYIQTQLHAIPEQKDDKARDAKSSPDKDDNDAAKTLVASLEKLLSDYQFAKEIVTDLPRYREMALDLVRKLNVNIRSHCLAAKLIINHTALYDLIDDIPLILVKNGFDFRGEDGCYSLVAQAINYPNDKLTCTILHVPGFHINYARYHPAFQPLRAALAGITERSEYKQTDPRLNIIKRLIVSGAHFHSSNIAGFPSPWQIVHQRKNKQLIQLFRDYDRVIPLLLAWFTLDSRNEQFLKNFNKEAAKLPVGNHLELNIMGVTCIADLLLYAVRYPESEIFKIIEKILPAKLLMVFVQEYSPLPARSSHFPSSQGRDLAEVFLYARLHPRSHTARLVRDLITQQILPDDVLTHLPARHQQRLDDMAALSVAQTGFLDKESTLYKRFATNQGEADIQLWNHIADFVVKDVQPLTPDQLAAKIKDEKSLPDKAALSLKDAKSSSGKPKLPLATSARSSRFHRKPAGSPASAPSAAAARSQQPEDKKPNIIQIVQQYENDFNSNFEQFKSAKTPEETASYKHAYLQAFFALQDIAAFHRENDGGASQALLRIEDAMRPEPDNPSCTIA